VSSGNSEVTFIPISPARKLAIVPEKKATCDDVSWSIISQHYKRVYGMTQLENVLSWMRHIITFPRIQGKRDLTDGWRPP